MNVAVKLPPDDSDPLLRPFLTAQDAAEAECLLGDLVANHAQPLAREIVRSRLRVSSVSWDGNTADAEDICGEVALQLTGRLQALRCDPTQAAIANFRCYVGTIVHNSCNHYLRHKYPERCRLKNRLRYVFNHRPGLTMWEDSAGNWLCGLAEWKPLGLRAADVNSPPPPDQLEKVRKAVGARNDLRRLLLPDLLHAFFKLSDEPVNFEELVGVVADVYGIHDLQPVRNSDDSADILASLPDEHADVATLVERRTYLAILWREICELRPRQRTALLLNLRDPGGQDMLPMLVLLGVVSLPDIAASLALPMTEFGELWDRLPLDDATIATRLNLTRQQVINLRKSARERLARRMGSR